MFEVVQKSSDFIVRTLIGHMGKRTELCSSLERIKIEEQILLGWQQLDQVRSVIFSRPKGGKWMGSCELKGKDISGTGNGVSEVRRSAVKIEMGELGWATP